MHRCSLWPVARDILQGQILYAVVCYYCEVAMWLQNIVTTIGMRKYGIAQKYGCALAMQELEVKALFCHGCGSKPKLGLVEMNNPSYCQRTLVNKCKSGACTAQGQFQQTAQAEEPYRCS